MSKPGKQSGVIPFRYHADELELLVITSSAGRRWIFPKGIVEPNMTPQESAATEAFEEAGVEGNVLEPALGSYDTRKWDRDWTVTMYPLEVTVEHKRWREKEFRERMWVSPRKARKLVADDLAELTRILEKRIEKQQY